MAVAEKPKTQEEERLDRAAAIYEETRGRNWASGDQEAVKRIAMRSALTSLGLTLCS